ncbi:MAG: hypothetical protein HQL79_07595 [Magnetococcales bacterium]|nr:hypothetical protein [Magnetococcales bacterium]
MTKKDTALDCFRSELELADWFCEFSDDRRARERGKQEIIRLWHMANEGGPEWRQAFNDAFKRAFMATGYEGVPFPNDE